MIILLDVMIFLGVRRIGPFRRFLHYDQGQAVAHVLYIHECCVAVRFI